MNVLFVCSGNGSGGISPIVRAQGESLRREGIGLEIFPIAGHGFAGYCRAIWRLRRHLRQKRHDILHAHYGLSAIAALLARRGERIVVSFMGDDLLGSRGPDGRRTLAGRLMARINVFLAGHCYDHVVVKSDEMLGKIKRGKRSVIPNGVDLGNFRSGSRKEARARLAIPDDRKVLLFIGDPNRAEKNFALSETALGKIGDAKAELLAVSDKPQEELADYYNAADLLLLTSFHEGSPNAVKEAMACNCPVVSTDVGDVRWVLGTTEGCFIADFDAEDIAAKIRLALDFAVNRGRTDGRKRLVELGLDSVATARKVAEVYGQVAG
jgi:teichuronic acid biosynthesis glycosyltransferase TuaC